MAKCDQMGDYHMSWELQEPGKGENYELPIYPINSHLVLKCDEGAVWGVIYMTDMVPTQCVYYEPSAKSVNLCGGVNHECYIREANLWTCRVKGRSPLDLQIMVSTFVSNAFWRRGALLHVWVDDHPLREEIDALPCRGKNHQYRWRWSYAGGLSMIRNDGPIVCSVSPDSSESHPWVAQATIQAEGALWGIAEIVRSFEDPVAAAAWAGRASIMADDGEDCSEFLVHSPGHPDFKGL